MSILLPCKPDLLLHFEKDTSRDVNKYYNNNKNMGNIYYPLSTNVSKFGKTSCYQGIPFLFHYIDTTKDFTVSFWQYDTAKQQKSTYLSFNKADASFYGGISFGYYDPTNKNGYRLLCLSSKVDPTGLNIDLRDASVYSYTNDTTNCWNHFEFSFDSANKIFRIFKNGTLVYSYTEGFYIYNDIKNIRIFDSYMYFDELLVIQSCLHKATFTPPTEPYVWLDGPEVFKDKDGYLYGYK